MGRPEQILQQGVFSNLTPLMYLQKYQQFIAFQIKNETGVAGDKGAILGAIAKSMGTMAGVSDTAFLFPKRPVQAVDFKKGHVTPHGIIYPTGIEYLPPKIVFTEFKALKGAGRDPLTLLNPDQIKFKNRVEDMGFEYRIIAAQNVNDAINQTYKILKDNYVKL